MIELIDGLLAAKDKMCPINKFCLRIQKEVLHIEDQCEYFADADNGNCLCLYREKRGVSLPEDHQGFD